MHSRRWIGLLWGRVRKGEEGGEVWSPFQRPHCLLVLQAGPGGPGATAQSYTRTNGCKCLGYGFVLYKCQPTVSQTPLFVFVSVCVVDIWTVLCVFVLVFLFCLCVWGMDVCIGWLCVGFFMFVLVCSVDLCLLCLVCLCVCVSVWHGRLCCVWSCVFCVYSYLNCRGGKVHILQIPCKTWVFLLKTFYLYSLHLNTNICTLHSLHFQNRLVNLV